MSTSKATEADSISKNDPKGGTGGVKPVRTNATIHRNTIEALGYDWYLQTNEFERQVPDNLQEQYKHENLVVDVSYLPTKEPLKTSRNEGPKFYVEIVTIKVVSNTDM